MPRVRTVLLVDTSIPGAKGSMARYAELVAKSVSGRISGETKWQRATVNLTFPFSLPDWLPGSVRTWLNHVWIMLTAGRRVSRHSADIVHVLDGSFGYLINRIRKKPVLATVHDLIPLVQQEPWAGSLGISRPASRLLERTGRGLKACTALVSDSESTKKDLNRYLNVDGRKVTVIQIALDENFHELGSRAYLAPRDSGGTKPAPYLMHVGNNAWYKNREGVVRIFSRLGDVPGLRLVLAGPPPTDALLSAVRASGCPDRIELIENPDDDELTRLYRNASLFLFPSLYEGYGWPPLEAMAFGCPVVCSSEASLPEVVGDAALLAPASDEDLMADHCRSVLTDSALAKRLFEAGRRRAAEFTTERMGQELVAAYDRVIEQYARTG